MAISKMKLIQLCKTAIIQWYILVMQRALFELFMLYRCSEELTFLLVSNYGSIYPGVTLEGDVLGERGKLE